ncbi:AAA family ATPase [Solirubrobacter sp. CPCC 204708]|uniref:AAA family ATPase n=1 Tax=Solirubrobacter deserti TaxID=2282478 RepID=A0ABT4RQI0_9ACTN|nr:LuxR family transcriptional regulator [Solirubrobacter deserti]MBE2320549.1 AAA family ATPase [Solirubrobacter deserti]MDA0140823.1 AAA family ATPase [Solirubrobacter deserti]
MRRTGNTLVGREDELGLVDALLARGGEALLLHGDPGVGKSAIAAAATAKARAAGATVLTTTGMPAEPELPYTSLQPLLWPVLDDAAGLPAPQRAALDAALGLSADAPKDPFRTGMAVLNLLGDAAERAPVVVVVEDAHWLDEATTEVLAFVARRIEDDPIAMLITSRENVPRPFRALPSRAVAPLVPAAAEALLHELDTELAPATRTRILEQAQGNPLGLVELLASAARAQAEPELPAWLPLSTRLERTFSARVADLPEGTRAALLVAGLTDRADVTEVLAAASVLAGAPLTLDALTPAVEAGLIEVGELRIAFGHPLMRSAIVQSGSETRRRGAHEALAATLDPARSLGHRVAAAAGVDDALADELARLAHAAQRRGSMVRAAETLGRAAALTGEETRRGARLLDAAELALDVGREDLVERLLADAAPLLLAPDDQQRRLWLQRTASRRAPAPAWFEAHLDRIEQLDDPARASQALLSVAFRAWWSDVPRPVRERLVAAARSLPPGSPPLIVAMVLALVAPADYGYEIGQSLKRIDPDEVAAELLRLGAVMCTIVGTFERGVTLGDRALERLRARGRYGLLATALVGRAWAGVFAGSWTASLAAAQEAEAVARETDQPLWVVAALSAQAALTGARGELDAALALADRADARLAPGAADGMRTMSEVARGLAQLAAGEPRAALAHFERVLSTGTEFVARWIVADAVDAAVAANAYDAGRSLLAQAETFAGPSRHLRASLAYARLVLTPEEAAAKAAFEASAEIPALRARVQLAHGGWLRRNRRPGEARALLRAARDTFEALDMGAPAERARGELRAAGEAVRVADVDVMRVLSPQELQIARLAADGLSNRDIGQALYLSHRTIGSHLYRIFPKLGVASRGELRALIAQ